MAKGYYGAKSKTFRAAKPATMRALRSAYVGRKNKKRDYRKLWIARINAAARMNDISYSRLIDGLKKSSIDINRKMLSELAIHDPAAFAQLCETASTSKRILEQAGINPDIRTGQLTDEQLTKIVQVITTDGILIEGDLRREKQSILKRLTSINCYRGQRHRRGLPVRGQRTRTNARTRKGKKKTVGAQAKKK